MGIRSWIRERVPGSDAVYEEARLKWLSRSTPAKVRAILASAQAIRLDLGGGNWSRDGWLTIDIDLASDLFWDLRRGIPFPDNSVDVVYSSHFFEHLTYKDGQAVLQETYRVLKPGGMVSVCVPDARMYIDAYLGHHQLDPNREYWEPAFISSQGIDLLNYVAYMADEHKCMFDQAGLIDRLSRVGFIGARARAFDAELDLEGRAFESIYADAWKPE